MCSSTVLAGVALAAAGSIADPMLKSRQARFNWGSSGRIVGGNTADPGQFPYIVSLRIIGMFHNCAGAIIADRWVLTYCPLYDGMGVPT